MHQKLWGYKVEEKLNVGVREQKGLNTTALKTRTLTNFAQDNVGFAADKIVLHAIFTRGFRSTSAVIIPSTTALSNTRQ
jgi:hypothetical protein